jgi:hypothetical protein
LRCQLNIADLIIYELQVTKDPATTKSRLIRSNDLLSQSSTETMLDMLKAHAGIKECSDETTSHINGVSFNCSN